MISCHNSIAGLVIIPMKLAPRAVTLLMDLLFIKSITTVRNGSPKLVFSHQNLRSFIISVGYQDVTNTEIQSPTSTCRYQHHDVTNITGTHFCRVYFFGSFNFIIAIRFRLGPYFQLLNLEEDFDKLSEVHNLENFPI